MIKILAFISAFLLIFSLSAQDTIPFTLTAKNNISVEVLLNEKDSLAFMFHTAAGEVSMMEETAKTIFDLSASKSVEAQSWGGDANEAKYVKNNHLQIGNSRFDSLVIFIDKLSGQGTQGKFGPSLFKGQILEINYDESILVVHPKLPLSTQENTYQKCEIVFDRGETMFIKGELKIGENKYINSFMIHSGYGGTILLDDEFASSHKIGDQVEILSESQLKDAYGNVLKTKKAILPNFEIAGQSFSNMPMSFFEGSIGNQKNSVMGSEMLKRFNIILDTKNSHIYLKPNSLTQKPFKDV